jgi:hypothetical protein
MEMEEADELVVPMMCPTINSYKRLLGGEVCFPLLNLIISHLYIINLLYRA